MMKRLESSFFRIQMNPGLSYGGNQAWFPKKYLQDYGCGVVSAADVILCLQGKTELTKKEYLEFTGILWKRYLPVIPKFGMNGIALKFGMNRFFRKHKMPYRCGWKVSGKKMYGRIEDMLEMGMPVILSIGPNFPKLWGKKKLTLYVEKEKNSYVPSTTVKAHYVTVTGMTREWIQISSWGTKYYLNKREYEEYVRKHSSSIVSNIICIRPLKRIK